MSFALKTVGSSLSLPRVLDSFLTMDSRECYTQGCFPPASNANAVVEHEHEHEHGEDPDVFDVADGTYDCAGP